MSISVWTEVILDNDNSIFATQFAVRAAADVLVEGPKGLVDEVRPMLGLLRERVLNCSGHPGDLVIRDMGILEWYIGHGKKAAIERMKRGLRITQTLPQSPANAWIRHVTEVHLAEVNTACKITKDALPKEAAILAPKVQLLAREIGTLRAYRAVSPY